MNQFNALALSAAVFLASLSPLAAGNAAEFTIPKGTRVLLCDLKVPSANGTTPPVVLLMTDKAGKMTVYDGLIAGNNLAPLPVTVMTDNNIRTTYGWTVPAHNDTINQYIPSIKMRLTVQKADQSALLMVNPVGYMTESARGSCQAGVADK
ncbi:hypothetical protein [Paenirhodobacter hankyongi]|uniref:Uncharacterized protein n=1 Tax=Paenirhodobacter hankyongi TaxID=2294033 RepID=A0A421BU84_9RHOB|nr:hypothetical protein [Sinirhodobacter hankyongi]RLL71844.1 hypothetical protein DYS74_04320 [Sinirhodobacter hankyongi]